MTTTPKVTKTTRGTKARPSVTSADNVIPLNSDISDQLETLRSDIMTLAKTVKDLAVDKVESHKDTAKTVASDKKDVAVEKYDELSTQAEAQIRENPISSMAMAIGAGFILGTIFRN